MNSVRPVEKVPSQADRVRRGFICAAAGFLAINSLLLLETASAEPSAMTTEVMQLRQRGIAELKGLQTDGVSLKTAAEAGIGSMAVNLEWQSYEWNHPLPCKSDEERYNGNCYRVNQKLDRYIEEATRRGIETTGIIAFTPPHLRIKACKETPTCAPENNIELADFARYIARRYDGSRGFGKIGTFVIYNEVNTETQFSIGCARSDQNCLKVKKTDKYVSMFNAATTAILAAQKDAKVLMSFDNKFGADLDNLKEGRDSALSMQTFLELTKGRFYPFPNIGISLHPYPGGDINRPDFSSGDLPYATYGTLGYVTGWLVKTFPDQPNMQELYLTESGISSSEPSDFAVQKRQLCKAYQYILGYPGIRSNIYHRMKDNRSDGGKFGLMDAGGRPKAAWEEWSQMDGLNGGSPRCGFELYPKTVLLQGVNGRGVRINSVVELPAGVAKTHEWLIDRNQRPGQMMVALCRIGDGVTVSNPKCEDATLKDAYPVGIAGYAYPEQQPGTIPLWRCDNITSGGKELSEQICPDDQDVHNRVPILYIYKK